jgi:hypothetical protein
MLNMKKIIRKNTILLIAIILYGMTLSACSASEPELDIDAQKTGFAQTANIQASQTVEARPTATETPIPTTTFTPTVTATNTPMLTPTEVNNEGNPPVDGTNFAQVIAQEPDDNTIFKPGEAFSVTWTFQNNGTTTWTVNYYIEHAFGEQMGAQDKVYVWLPVAPGTSLPLTVNFNAPETTGTKVSNWKFFDSDGNAFYDFNITIVVSE